MEVFFCFHGLSLAHFALLCKRESHMSMNSLLFSPCFMVEPLLSGIVLGLVPVTMAGLFVTAYLQYRRGDMASF